MEQKEHSSPLNLLIASLFEDSDYDECSFCSSSYMSQMFRSSTSVTCMREGGFQPPFPYPTPRFLSNRLLRSLPPEIHCFHQIFQLEVTCSFGACCSVRLVACCSPIGPSLGLRPRLRSLWCPTCYELRGEAPAGFAGNCKPG